jgi:adenosylcobinamide-phosphate synthase
MAGALGLSLAGPRVYGGVEIDDATMGDGRRDATAADIRRALALYRYADAILIALVAAIAAIVIALI